VFGDDWANDKKGFPAYMEQRKAGLPFYLHPMNLG
jgi:hypothetical protein